MAATAAVGPEGSVGDGKPGAISRDRAERIARAHACINCREYNYRKFSVRKALPSLRAEFGELWHATLVCGVCGAHQELGIDDDGDVVYVT